MSRLPIIPKRGSDHSARVRVCATEQQNPDAKALTAWAAWLAPNQMAIMRRLSAQQVDGYFISLPPAITYKEQIVEDCEVGRELMRSLKAFAAGLEWLKRGK